MDRFGIFAAAIIVTVLAVPVVAIVSTRHRAAEFTAKCHAAGGHEKPIYRDTLCVRPDGRLIPIEGGGQG